MGAPCACERPFDVANVTQVALGLTHTCALANGQVFCWGKGSWGQTGAGHYYGSRVPEQIAGLSGVTEIVGGHNHTCAKHAGGVSCWGYNDRWQLGNFRALLGTRRRLARHANDYNCARDLRAPPDADTHTPPLRERTNWTRVNLLFALRVKFQTFVESCFVGDVAPTSRDLEPL